jgi:hypothetical protein
MFTIPGIYLYSRATFAHSPTKADVETNDWILLPPDLLVPGFSFTNHTPDCFESVPKRWTRRQIMIRDMILIFVLSALAEDRQKYNRFILWRCHNAFRHPAASTLLLRVPARLNAGRNWPTRDVRITYQALQSNIQCSTPARLECTSTSQNPTSVCENVRGELACAMFGSTPWNCRAPKDEIVQRFHTEANPGTILNKLQCRRTPRRNLLKNAWK